MLKGLSGVLEKLPALDFKKPTEATTVSAPATPTAAAPVTPAATAAPVSGSTPSVSTATKYLNAFAGVPATESIREILSVENADLVVTTAYKQVFGNAHLMESERSVIAESKVRKGEITVLEFVRALAKSDHYRKLFWEKHTNVTAIELNFKHLLGRAPKDYAEISEHIQIIAEGGFEAEIDAYLDSDEYFQTFGDMYVPYPRGYNTQTGVNGLGYTRSFSLFGAACGSDKSQFSVDQPAVKANLLSDGPGEIPELANIPDTLPEGLAKTPMPRVPTELRGIARELLIEMRARKGLSPINY